MDSISNKNILIIEDDDKLRFNLERMVESLHHQVSGSFPNASGYFEEITSKLEETNLILLDINLPGEYNGVEFAKKIKDDFNIPILYVTGNVEEDTFIKASEGRIYGYLPKPFSKVQLEFAMKMCLLRFNFENEARKHFKKIKEKEKLIQIGEFAGGFVHDLNNFNGLIMNSIDMINHIVGTREEGPFLQIQDYASKGKLGTMKIKQLSDRYRKIILNQRNKKFETIDLNSLLNDVIRFFDHKLQQHKIELYLDIEENLRIESNEIILTQSIVNLVSNSIYEIVEKDIKERWVKVKAYTQDNKILIEISDSGPGIDSKIVNDIFEFGFSTKEESLEEGSGLGLSFVRNNIQNELKGRIELLKDLEYTTFQIQLPA